MSDTKRFDLVILGSGSTAFAAALRAQELGKTSVMTEARTVGGTCVNRGCLPSKNLIEAAKLLHDAATPRYPGIQAVRPALDFAALVAQKDQLVDAYRDKKYEGLLGGAFSIEHGAVRFLDPHTVEVGGKRLAGESVLIATGSRPILPDIEGLDSVPYLTSDLLGSDAAADLKECPRSLLIVGAGYIAVELGQMFSRFGCAVTLVERGDTLFRGYEPAVGPAVRSILEGEGIQVLVNAKVTRVRQDDGGVMATVELPRGSREVHAERILVATGRRPNTDAISIERSGVELDPSGSVRVDRMLRTNVSHIFAAGDVIGRQQDSQMATPVGSRQGGLAAHNALSGEAARQVDHRVIPRAIFTDPPIAVVGVTEAEAIAAGHRCWCSTIPMTLVPRAAAIRDTQGFVKMVADADSNEVLGVTMIGNSAAEVIHEAAIALRFRATIHDFIDQLHVYPTMAEALKIVAISRFKDPAKLSCCAE